MALFRSAPSDDGLASFLSKDAILGASYLRKFVPTIEADLAQRSEIPGAIANGWDAERIKRVVLVITDKSVCVYSEITNRGLAGRAAHDDIEDVVAIRTTHSNDAGMGLTVRPFGTSATSTLSLGAFERCLAPALAQFVFNRCDHLARRNRAKYGAAAQAPTPGAPVGRLHLVAGGVGLPPKTNRAHAVAWKQMADFENAFVTLHDRGQEIYNGTASFASLAEGDAQEAETLKFFDQKVAELLSQGWRLVQVEGRGLIFQR